MKKKLIHCSYHKCLTVYFQMVFGNRMLSIKNRYKHFNSLIDDFYEELPNFRIASVNNHALDLDKIGSYRISRFIRDPRDLVVSGYFYHKRGAEEWSNVVNPKSEDFKVVNGNIPEGLKEGQSYATYLQSLSDEDGLIAEIEFRKFHFDSMMKWPLDDPDIKLFKYDDILGSEKAIFNEIISFFGLSKLENVIGQRLAEKYSAKNQMKKTSHIRNPQSRQWEKYFTPKVMDHFNTHHPDLIEYYDF